jgi:hypothetical protein
MDKDIYLFVQGLIPATVQTFDWWNNQFETEEDEDPFEVPAVFMEILPYQTISEGRLRQRANITFNLHIGQHLYSRPGKGSKRQSKAMDHFKLCDDIFAALSGKNNNNNISSLKRTGVAPNHNYEGYIVHVHTYTCGVTTDASIHPTIPIPADTPVLIDIT